MSLKKVYKTVADEGGAVYVDRKSRFIASVRPISNEEEALEYLSVIRSKYADARHNVYAYVVDENNIFRYTDDGEPSGTAGMPVLDAIRKAGLVDVIVVVTRYFGGTLLGTGGLVRAYGTCASEGLKDAGIVTRMLCDTVDVTVDYVLLGAVEHKIRNDGYITGDTDYGENVTFRVYTPSEETEKFIADITDVTNGRVKYTLSEKRYINKEEK
ncbi:MAG: YigZ family protein [Firmicutes bacterium]|nr:YigZ family protein [Bacillota bacterium]